jgi:hypothetical protein
MQHLHPLTGRCVPSASIWPHARAERALLHRIRRQEIQETLRLFSVAPSFRSQGDDGLNTGAPVGGDVAGEQG